MSNESENEKDKMLLLRKLNENRVRDGKAPLSQWPEVGCTSCGEVVDSAVPLFQSKLPYIRTCQRCVLKRFPFSKLQLPPSETIKWYANNPTFHRTSDYGLVLTDQALYLYSPFWLALARWRRYAINDIRGVMFKDSRWFPSLRIQTSRGSALLRTPIDDADEMDFDRKNLKEAVEQVRSAISKGTENGA